MRFSQEALESTAEALAFLKAPEARIVYLDSRPCTRTPGERVEFKFYQADVLLQPEIRASIIRLIGLLRKREVTVWHETEVMGLSPRQNGEIWVDLVSASESKRICAQNVLVATGRTGTKWFSTVAKDLAIHLERNSVDVGVRIETQKEVFDGISHITADPKYKFSFTEGEGRTFCACIGGEVTLARLEEVSIIDGHFGRQMSQNANIAVVARVEPPSGMTGLDFGLRFARPLNRRRKPLAQPLSQFLGEKGFGRNSPKSCSIEPTLEYYARGDVGQLLESSVYRKMVEGITSLMELFPLLQAEDSLVFAPVIDRYWDRVIVDRNFETNVKGVYVVGDAAGYARGILQATWTGLAAANGILMSSRGESDEAGESYNQFVGLG